ncbi:argonaute/piwi family protein [Hyphomonas pacifica]|uniref:Protein argonaute n=1 Tax=Hyphomonas pacifica TaxID=1280941 RepID=A0A062U2W9_9PROT|nr:hypothetical protein [Hyphomonas pacifica]KCZ52627.1 hypothetical protein HY2_07750 [Hyphomonas pacifica]RAN32830.1 hypothetical protein HY3_13940 [Hyphomonas pacifica]
MRETNIYELSGLETVSTSYRLFELQGAPEFSPEYYAGVSRLVRTLSRRHQAPFTSIQRGETMLLAAPEALSGDLAEHHNLARWVATLKSLGDSIEIDCSVSGDELDPIRLRFLNFMIQSPLFNHGELWQPRAGDAFYYRKPADTFDGIELFEGIAVRAVPYPGGGFGVMLDARTKLISQRAVGAYADPNFIRRLKNTSCLYRMGDIWYEIKISGANQTVSHPILFKDNQPVSLKAYLHEQARQPIPKSLIDLKGDGVVLTYRGSDSAEVKAAPAELCFPIVDTHSKRGARHQRRSIQAPHIRRSKAYRFKQRFLRDIKIGNAVLSVADQPAALKTRPIDLPELQFGSNRILYGTDRGGDRIDLRQYAKNRRTLLERADVGFFETSPLEPQCLVLPKSVMNAWGNEFVRDLTAEVKRLHPTGNYKPTVIAFDDVSATVDARSQAEAIFKLAEDGDLPPGDCAIMIHRTKGKARAQEELPALLINKLRKSYGVNAAIFHATVPGNAYRRESASDGARYVRKRDEKGRFSGYLTGAALNKILLPNAKWPFVLKDELVADIVVGIDVKHHTAALVLIAEGGRIIRHTLRLSTKNEKLPAGIVETKLVELISNEAPHLSRLTKTIAIHRDGRIWPSELKGLRAACRKLADDGHIDPAFDLNVFEVSKSAPARLRLFSVDRSAGRKPRIENPELGDWMMLTETDGYVCTTGAPLLRGGAARPLHVKQVAGDMSLQDALSDVFRLSCLTWTRPESCSRLPISLKLCDMLLMDEGTAHDEDEILHANDDTPAVSA